MNEKSNKTEKTDIVKKYFPPGYDYMTEIIIMTILSIYAGILKPVAIILDMTELNKMTAQSGNYDAFRITINGNTLTNFADYIEGRMLIYLFMIIWAVISIFLHYRYHYKDSKSIYRMKMLKNRMELHIRACIVPLIFMIFSAILMILIIFITYKIYFYYIPIEIYKSPELQLDLLLDSLKHFSFW